MLIKTPKILLDLFLNKVYTISMKEKLCPICKKNNIYKKEKKVKDGYTVPNGNGGYRFIQKGWRIKKEEWWSCKICTKILSAEEYTNKMIEIFK